MDILARSIIEGVTKIPFIDSVIAAISYIVVLKIKLILSTCSGQRIYTTIVVSIKSQKHMIVKTWIRRHLALKRPFY